jgi:hypothetical protein
MRAAALLLLAACAVATSYADVLQSRGGNYYAVVTREGGAKQFPEQNRWSATIFHRSGKERYTLDQKVPYDVQFPALYLSDEDGRAIVIGSFEARVEFYDGRGNLVRVLQPSASAEPTYERVIKCSVAGDRAAFLVSSPDKPHAEVFVTGLDGTEIWRRTMPEKTAGEVFLSSDGTYLLAGCHSSDREIVMSTLLFDQSGNLVRTLDILFRYADIAPKRNMLVLSDRNLVILESLDGSTDRLSWSTARTEEIVTGIRIVDGHVAASVESVDLATGAPRYTGATLVVLKRNGEEFTRRVLKGSSAYPAVLNVDDAAVTISSGKRKTSIPREQIQESP